MITRGYLIGEIIDRLSDLSGQVTTRCKLGLTDLNVHLENFYKPILSDAFGCSLRNLNSERSNEPGLDLGDKISKVAFQVTSTAKASKVNNTIDKLTEEQLLAFKTIYVFIIGKRQNSYKLKKELCKKADFDEQQIIDTNGLCQRLMMLELENLHRIYDHIKRETQRVQIELEIPDAEGSYPTGMSKIAERLPHPQIGTGEPFLTYLKSERIEENNSQNDIVQTLSNLSSSLQKLPRITRDFFSLLIERREIEKGHCTSDMLWFNIDKLERVMGSYDWQGELRILDQEGFAFYQEPDEYSQSGRLVLLFPDTFEGFDYAFLGFVEKMGLTLAKPLVSLDFSDF